MFRVDSNRTVSAPLLTAAVLACCLSMSAFAGSVSAYLLPNGNIGITVDENCNGVLNGFAGPVTMPCGFQNDPGPGGLLGVMTYDMVNPPGLVPGDVLMMDQQGWILDVIRFNPNGGPGNPTGSGSLVFYSDNLDGFDSGADTSGPPVQYYGNTITILEVGTEGVNGAYYTPVAGQPGFVAGAAAPVTYHFISDVPEPGSIILLGSGVALLFVRRLRRKLHA
jgi:hypothetical protein